MNVKDIVNAIIIVVLKNVKSGDYNVVNSKNFSISKIILHLKRNKNFRSKIIWGNKKIINDKILKLRKLPYWKPKYSKLENLTNFILKNENI